MGKKLIIFFIISLLFSVAAPRSSSSTPELLQHPGAPPAPRSSSSAPKSGLKAPRSSLSLLKRTFLGFPVERGVQGEKLGGAVPLSRGRRGAEEEQWDLSQGEQGCFSQQPPQPPCLPLSSLCAVLAWVLALGLFFLLLFLLVHPFLKAEACGGVPKPQPPCPEGWVGFSQRCYLASEAEGNWSVSWDQCRSLGATLAGVDSTAEMDFLHRYQGLSAHWLGIRRNGTTWIGPRGAEHNTSWWPIRGDGGCAYLNKEKGVSSSRCSTERPWICSAQAGSFPSE